jgi:hypothetical protein
MAEPFKARQVEEAAAALYRVEEAEDGVQPVPVGRIGLLRDHLSGERLQRLLRFGDEFLK